MTNLAPVMAPVRPRWNWFLAPVLALALMAVSGAADAKTAPDSFADLAQELLPSVVNISTTQVIEGRGVLPHRPLEWNPSDLAKGEDTFIKEAVAYLKGHAPAGR